MQFRTSFIVVALMAFLNVAIALPAAEPEVSRLQSADHSDPLTLNNRLRSPPTRTQTHTQEFYRYPFNRVFWDYCTSMLAMLY